MQETYSQTTDLFLEEPVVYAGFWERFGAAFIDGIIIMIPNVIFRLALPESQATVLSIILGWLYSASLESSSGQATFGKKALGLKVTSLDGQRISFGQASARHFGKILSSIILFIGYFMMLWDVRKQTLHDRIASTIVVKA